MDSSFGDIEDILIVYYSPETTQVQKNTSTENSWEIFRWECRSLGGHHESSWWFANPKLTTWYHWDNENELAITSTFLHYSDENK